MFDVNYYLKSHAQEVGLNLCCCPVVTRCTTPNFMPCDHHCVSVEALGSAVRRKNLWVCLRHVIRHYTSAFVIFNATCSCRVSPSTGSFEIANWKLREWKRRRKAQVNQRVFAFQIGRLPPYPSNLRFLLILLAFAFWSEKKRARKRSSKGYIYEIRVNFCTGIQLI